eukprot:CAMPEP_0168215866 /NCGR_PEP_ID=MMETSP0140_2-20121125/6240_1 /TAXON_ID=44445 /ORGANISM="Pseudo-nitzschia australis, Strain 10249 10 AB" /LENGTH=92 /DNA_ID=CAMNT_0008143179 /DNA_START=792 /DNA_END=1071 /DNA_ORIENTATION=-
MRCGTYDRAYKQYDAIDTYVILGEGMEIWDVAAAAEMDEDPNTDDDNDNDDDDNDEAALVEGDDAEEEEDEPRFLPIAAFTGCLLELRLPTS